VPYPITNALSSWEGGRTLRLQDAVLFVANTERKNVLDIALVTVPGGTQPARPRIELIAVLDANALSSATNVTPGLGKKGTATWPNPDRLVRKGFLCRLVNPGAHLKPANESIDVNAV
jgi:hypothetical protein